MKKPFSILSGFILWSLMVFPVSFLFAKSFELMSPDRQIKLTIQVKKNITYFLSFQNKPILVASPISLTIDRGKLGENPRITKTETRSKNGIIRPFVRQKRAEIIEKYNELEIRFKKNFYLIFRAYDDGVAYRFGTRTKKPVVINAEEANFNFAGNYLFYFPEEESMHTHFERLYEYLRLSEVSPQQFCAMPVVVDVPGGPKVAITESSLEDYPGMFLHGTGGAGLQSKFAPVILEVAEPRRNADRNEIIKKRADYIAKTSGSRLFPWRVIVVAEKDGDLIESDLVYKLARKCTLKDLSWIHPGKVAWDWWNANNVYGVDFKSGLNTDTYKYYVDFAAKFGLDYVILDEGWSETDNVLQVRPSIDMEALSAYARQKKVGLILWVLWKPLLKQMDAALDQYREWGVKGIKVDFMQRDDQEMVNIYWKIAQAAAKRHLLVDFHGAYKPAGLRRTYPNVITREGVKGLENSKWSTDVSPEHTTTIPFIRMLAGPMDFTPGAMINAQKKNFRPIFDRPMSMGTRCHQLAMYVVFESPLQMLCDSPTHYYREPECMEFLSAVPTVWDETRVLAAKVGDYVIVARRSGNEWYVGAMTDWTPREFEILPDFLDAAKYIAKIYQDGINADRYGNDYRKISREITPSESLKIKLAPGGGWVARFVPKN